MQYFPWWLLLTHWSVNLGAISVWRNSSNPLCLAIISSLDTIAVKEDTTDKTHTIKYDVTYCIHRTTLELNSRTSSPLSASLIFWRHRAIGWQTLRSLFAFSYKDKHSSPTCFTTAILRSIKKHREMMLGDMKYNQWLSNQQTPLST